MLPNTQCALSESIKKSASVFPSEKWNTLTYVNICVIPETITATWLAEACMEYIGQDARAVKQLVFKRKLEDQSKHCSI